MLNDAVLTRLLVSGSTQANLRKRSEQPELGTCEWVRLGPSFIIARHLARVPRERSKGHHRQSDVKSSSGRCSDPAPAALPRSRPGPAGRPGVTLYPPA